MSKRILAHLALLAANLIYGGNYTVAKEVMPEWVQPFGFIVARGIGAVLLFWLFHSFLYKEKVDKKDYPKLALCALFGIAINQMLFFKGLNITTPINASIIMTSTPILVLIVAAVMLNEKITWSKMAGIFLGLVGALLIITMGADFSFGSDTITGDLLVFINSTSYGVYLVMVKPLMKKYEPLTVIKWIYLFGFFMVLPFGYQEFVAVDWANMPFNIWMGVLYVVIGLSFLAYLFNTFALKHVSPSLVSIYIYSQPIFATFIAIMVGKDELTVLKAISAILIFAGVYLVSMPGRKRNRKEA